MSLDFSIIISTHNRAAALPELIGHISRQDLGPYKGELIIIDNASTDETGVLLRRTQCDVPLVPLTEPAQGKNKALNLGMQQARGRMFIFTDDDVVPDERWVFHILEGAARWPDDGVFCGPIALRFPPSAPDWVRELPDTRLLPLYCRFQPVADDIPQPTDTVPFGANLAIRAEVFTRQNYDETVGPRGKVYAMGSETELLLRLREQGMRFIYLPAARIEHLVREDQVVVPWMLRRAYNYGRGRARRALRSSKREPRSAWRDYLTLVRLAAMRLPALTGSDKERFERGWAYHQFRGFLAETRGTK